jgi:hypothetical protein
MPTKLQLVGAACVGIVAFDLVTLPRRRKYKKILKEQFTLLLEENESLRAQMSYLIMKINDSDAIGFDEFDFLMLSDVKPAS